MTPEQLKTILGELDSIDRRAHQMALERLEAAMHRPTLADEAAPLSERLGEISALLKQEAPPSRRQRSSQISESTMDLQYVMGQTDYTSLRVGRRIRERVG